MKNLKSTIEGVWFEIKPIVLTEEQKTLFTSKEESDKEAKAILLDKLKKESEITPDESTLALASATYNYLKPAVPENAIYEFAGCSMSIGEKLTGILNYRINGEHKQIRF